MKDYYDILGIPRNASKEDIKRAWRILAHQYHPDKETGNEQKFRDINEAYRILSGEATRAEYDRGSKTRPGGNSSSSSSTSSASRAAEKSAPQPQPSAFANFMSKGGLWVILIALGIVSSLISGNSGSATQSTTPPDPNSFLTGTSDTSNGPNNSLTPNDVFGSTHSKPPTCEADEVLNTTKTACISHSTACSNEFPNSTWDGSKCTCTGAYEWNPDQTACVTQYQYCPEKYSNSFYDASTNTCACSAGYVWNSDNSACVDPTTVRSENCSAKYPNSEYLEPDPNTPGGTICDCKAGYYWNNDRTACYSQNSFDQECINYYGSGSYSTTENGKRVCDCSYGYSWNIGQTSCVTTASIDTVCVRDVGRNSYYLGTISNGKYDCSTPY